MILSPPLKGRHDLCTIVPLSQTPPEDPQSHHCLIKFKTELPYPFLGKERWLKGDMVFTAKIDRLSLCSVEVLEASEVRCPSPGCGDIRESQGLRAGWSRPVILTLSEEISYFVVSPVLLPLSLGCRIEVQLRLLRLKASTAPGICRTPSS